MQGVLEQGVAQGLIEVSDPEMFARLINAEIGMTTASSAAFGEPADLGRFSAAKEFVFKAVAPVRSEFRGDPPAHLDS
ncbi:MAG: hypothetical protein ABR507_11140 [Actinomycetota bacterium]